jgi:WXXGXW repeat (2 copies)
VQTEPLADEHSPAVAPKMTLMTRSSVILVALTSVASTACYGRGVGLLPAILGTAIVTAAIVSATAPPPPRVVYIPEPRPGYAWQPGYWTLDEGQWFWVDGRWIPLQPGYSWSPTHWEHDPDGTWRLVPGQWLQPPPPPPTPGPGAPPPPPPQ